MAALAHAYSCLGAFHTLGKTLEPIRAGRSSSIHQPRQGNFSKSLHACSARFRWTIRKWSRSSTALVGKTLGLLRSESNRFATGEQSDGAKEWDGSSFRVYQRAVAPTLPKEILLFSIAGPR